MTSKGAIHVFTQKQENEVWTNPIIHLPKLRNIQFELKDKSKLVSMEYGGMTVSNDQNFGTLIGLKRGLLLEVDSSEVDDRIFICPHGKVKPGKSGETEIDVANLRTPSFFKYVLRTDLQDIKAGKERVAWEYLALLHAHTSGLLPDPFTRCLGLTKGTFHMR